jgi:hypothetical protein
MPMFYQRSQEWIDNVEKQRQQHTEMAIQGMSEQLTHAVGSLQVEMYATNNTIAKYHSDSQQQCQLIKAAFLELKASVTFSNTRF